MTTRTTLLAALSVLMLAACGGPGSSYDAANESRSMAAPAPMAEAKLQALMPMDGNLDEAGGAGGEAPAAQQYIAYSHSLGMRLPVAAIEPTLQGHVDACNKAGPSVCMVTNSWMNSYSEDEASASLYLRATPAWIEQFLSGAEAEAKAAKGEITNRQTTAEDLTVSIIDSDARLKAQQTLQARLEQLLADRPGKLGELLETERELARVNGEIDSLKSTLAALRLRVDMSQLSVSYETKRNPVSQGALQPLGDAFGSFFYNLAGALAAVITAFAIGLPWLILLGGFLWIWLKLIWPRIRRKKS
ncbi:MAG: lipoprotein [Hyphomonadaceae bacterium BRH_c29]|nr:MAG: lipoprotein [Hyphomonadaceae bacterium BRH_c29]